MFVSREIWISVISSNAFDTPKDVHNNPTSEVDRKFEMGSVPSN